MTSTIAQKIATPSARLETDQQSAHRIANLVAETFGSRDAAASLVDKGNDRWGVTIHFRTPPGETALRALVGAAAGTAAADALTFERVAARDWVSESLAGLKPVEAGRFMIHGAHDRARIAVNRIGIEIEAAVAFGTGHHGTTRGCLLALEQIRKAASKWRPRSVRRHPEVGAKRAAKGGSPGRHHCAAPRILDLGTGSGVLAIAAARALRHPVLATDIDPQAVRAARANAKLNRVGALVEVVRADGVLGQQLRARGPFDLVLANILLGPLQRLAAPLIKVTAPGARVVLSGLLPSQANAVIAAYRALALERRIDLDGWTTLVFTRRARSRSGVARHYPAS